MNRRVLPRSTGRRGWPTTALLFCFALAFTVCHRNQPPETPLGLIGNSYGLPESTYGFVTWTDDPEGDDISYRFSWGDGDTSDWGTWMLSGYPYGTRHTWTSAGVFRISSQARDRNEAVSDWREPRDFRIGYPPETPASPAGPASGWLDTELEFTATTTDPDGDRVRFRFDWGDGDTSDWTELVPSGSTGTMSHAWWSPGTYNVRAQARDAYGARSGWSDRSPVTLAGRPGTLIWACESDGPVASSPAAFTAGLERPQVYFGSHDDHLYAVGPVEWRYRCRNDVVSSPAVGSNNVVYVGEKQGYPSSYFYAFDPDGTLKWQHEAANSITGSPAVSSRGTVYFGSADFYLYAVSTWGELEWQFPTFGAIRTAPAIGSDGTVYVGAGTDLFAVSSAGLEQWRYRADDSINSSPAIRSDGSIVFGCDDGRVYALNPDGTLKWQHDAGDTVRSSPAVGAGDAVFVGCDDSRLLALNADGTLRWQFSARDRIRSSPALDTAGNVYFGSCDGCLYAVDPSGALLWRYQTEGPVRSSPAITPDKQIIFGSYDGRVYALWAYAGLADAPWPMYGHDARHTGRAGFGR